jgi:hypothetical protein
LFGDKVINGKSSLLQKKDLNEIIHTIDLMLSTLKEG